MNTIQVNRNKLVAVLLVCALAFAAATGIALSSKEGEKMVQKLSVNEIIQAKQLDLGVTEWYIVGVPGASNALDTIILGGGIQPDPTSMFRKEFDPFMVMTLIPQLMPELLKVTGVNENTAVGLEKVEFSSSFKPGTQVRMRGMLISGELTSEGYLLYRVGVSIEVSDEAGYSLVAEVLFLAGNP